METSPFYTRLLPSEEILKTSTMREKEQLSMVIGANLVFMILFALFGITLFIFKYVTVGVGALILLFFFVNDIS